MIKQDYFESGKYERSPKLFITNLPPNIPDDQLKKDLEPLFQPFGKIKSINVKKHKSGQYSYAFLEFQKIQDAIRAIETMDQQRVHDRPMKVRQDRQSQGCFNCKKTGHFAKQCPNNPNKDQKNGQKKQRSREKYQRSKYELQKPYRRGERDYKKRGRERSDSYRNRYEQRRRSPPRSYSPYSEWRRRQRRNRIKQRSRSKSRSRSYSDSYNGGRGGGGYYSRRQHYPRDGNRENHKANVRREPETRKHRQESHSGSYDHVSH